MRNTKNTMKKRKPSNRANVLPLTRRRREAMDLVKFITPTAGGLARSARTKSSHRHHRPFQTRARSAISSDQQQ
jgi:hypothetical protein